MTENRASEDRLLIRPFRDGDETGMAGLVARTLRVSNRDDYAPEYLEKIAEGHSPAFFARQAKDARFYVVCDGDRLVGCGGITGYRGSTAESYLLSVFVLPEYQGRGIGRRIMETLESDAYFRRARRIELGASLTAVGFYRKLGYEFKNGVTAPDKDGVVRMEKRKGGARMTNEKLREGLIRALEDMKDKALAMGIRGVAAAAALDCGGTVDWIGEMKVVETPCNPERGWNLVGIAWAKCAEVIATEADSGDPDHRKILGEYGFVGGAYDVFEGCKLAFAFSGALSEEDLAVAKYGIGRMKEYLAAADR